MKVSVICSRLGKAAAALCLLSAVFSAHAQKSPPRLFEHLKPGSVQELPSPREAVASAAVRVNIPGLKTLDKNDRLFLNFASNMEWVGTIERIEKRSDDSFSVFGDIENTPHGRFILTVEQEVLIANVDASYYNMQFKTRYVRDGIHLLFQINDNRYQPCADNEPSQTNWEPEQDDSEFAPPADLPSDFQTMGGDGDDFGTAACVRPRAGLDVMIVYTNVARNAMGGVNAANAEAQACVDAANDAYNLSNVNITMRLVYRGEVTYNESGSYEDHRNRLTNTSDGIMDNVHTLRDQYRADDVILLVNDGAYCGIAWCHPVTSARAFCIVNWTCTTGNNSFAHELGHNQGCAHNREDAGSCNLYSYSYGHRFIGNSSNRYRTIMSYATGSYSSSTRIRRFSNPNVFFDGVRTGVAIGSSGESHNTQTIENTRLDREVFRRLDMWADFAHGGTEIGSFDLPYNTTIEAVNAMTTTLDTNLIDYPELNIKAGSQGGAVNISKRMRVKACGGVVRIGAP